MPQDPDRKPLLLGRGFVQVCRLAEATGIEVPELEDLLRSGRFPGVLVGEDRTTPVAVFDDQLPTREDLQRLGARVRADYDPESMRSHPGWPDDLT